MLKVPAGKKFAVLSDFAVFTLQKYKNGKKCRFCIYYL